jgi:uncharacterized membrane protein YeiH
MLLLNIFEIIGTIAFAISGALIGIEKKLDLFGIVFLSITTAVGGGIFRDIVIGNIPPVAFIRPVYCTVSVISSFITFALYKKIIRLKNIIFIFDAIGLGVFTAIGSNAALAHNINHPFLVISMGLITGVGGGLLRDVFVKDIPYVFRKEIYAVASLAGSLGFYLTHLVSTDMMPLYVCFIITFVTRILSVRFNINLPVYKIKE